MDNLLSWIDSPIEKGLILLFASTALYFIIDFKKNIQKLLDRHSDRLDRSTKSINSDLRDIRQSMAQHSSDIDSRQKAISGDFIRMQETIFTIKEELREELIKVVLEFKELKMELETLDQKIRISSENFENQQGKVEELEESVEDNVKLLEDVRAHIESFKGEFASIRQMVKENRDALVKSKEVLKVYTAEVKILKKKIGGSKDGL